MQDVAALRTLSPGEADALSAFKARAQAVLGARLQQLVLFGSRARGEGHEHSDLDVLVLMDVFDRALRRQLLDAAADVDAETGLVISPVVMDPAMFSSAYPLRPAVERDGVIL